MKLIKTKQLFNNVVILDNVLYLFNLLFRLIISYIINLHAVSLHSVHCYDIHLLHSLLFIVYSFISPNRWIQFVHRDIISTYVYNSLFDWFKNKFSFVYIIIHPNTSYFYIGETSNLLFNRLHEHQYSAKNAQLNRLNSTFFHRFLCDNTAESFIILPITIYNVHTQSTEQRKLLEQYCIKKFQPKLNSKSAPFNSSIHSMQPSSQSKHTKKKQTRPSKAKRRRKKLSIPSNSLINSTSKLKPFSHPSSVLTSFLIKIHNSVKQYFVLSELLNDCRHDRKITIQQQSGITSITKWKQVDSIARKSQLIFIQSQLFSSILTFHSFCSILKRMNNINIQFTIYLKKSCQYIINQQQLKSLIQHRYSWQKELCILPINYLLSILLKAKSSIINKLHYYIIKKRIEYVLKQKYNISNIPSKIHVKIPHMKTELQQHLLQHYKSMIRRLLYQLPFFIDVQFYFYNILRFINTKSKNIKQLLINHIPTSQHYSSLLPPCTCNLLRTLLQHENNNSTQHLLIRPYEFQPSIQKIINTNTTNIPIPSTQFIRCALIESFNSFIYQISSFLLYEQIDISIINSILIFISNISNDLPPSDTIPTIDEVLKLKGILSHCIICPFDKNINQLCVMCPQLYHQYLTKTYITDPHYITSTFTNESEWLTCMYQFYFSIDGERYARFNKRNKFPYGYVLPKHKDSARTRPIVSMKYHPLKYIYKLIGRCLQFLLRSLDTSIVPHYVLFKTFDLKIRLNEYLQSLQSTFPPNTHIDFLCVTSDIKNMFTSLTHESIINAILWLIHTSIETNNRSNQYIVLDEYDAEIIHFYPTYTEINKLIMIDITTLIPLIVQFDLSHIHFSIGTKVRLQQICGAPMGGLLSQWYAIIVCAYNEFNFHSSLHDSIKLTMFNVRYMDDLISIIAYIKNSILSLQQSQHHLQSLLTQCYDCNLELEPTSSSSGFDRHFTYLDCTLSIIPTETSNTIILSPYMKNSQSVRIHHKQIFYNYQHFKSSSPTSVKIGVIKSTILRLYRNSNNNMTFIFSIVSLYNELTLLQYPSYILLNTLKSCYHQSSQQLFARTYEILKIMNRIQSIKQQSSI